MFLDSYSKNNLKFDDVQFILAIALDNLNQELAARTVLLFGSISRRKIISLGEIQMQREAARSVAENDFMSHNGKNVKKNIIMATIDYFWENNVLQVSDNNRHYTGYALRSLEELVRGVTRKQIYLRAMSIAFDTPRKKLIVAYMNTRMFSVQFSKAVKSLISVTASGSKDSVSHLVMVELKNGFTEFVDKFCSNGTYQPGTANPDAFLLRKNDDSGPLMWYRKSKSGEFFKILNKRGLNTNIAGGDKNYTILDNVEIDTSSSEHSINFINICTKINAASCLLFTHKNENVAVYDIFSHLRDSMQKESIRQFGQVDVIGCNVEPIDDITLDSNYSETTATDKINGRMFICELFEREFSRNLRKEHIYNRIYIEILRGTDMKTKNNGVRLFATQQHTPKTGNINNSDKLRILVDGYVALFDFIKFLNSSSNTRGVSINEVPVEIFRVANLLKRFRSFEEYIDYNEDVIRLYSEVESSPERSQIYVDGLYNNDTVYNVLSQRRMLSSDPDLMKLMQSNMSVFRNSVIKYSGEDRNKVLAQKLSNHAVGFTGLGISMQELQKLSLIKLEEVMYVQSQYVVRRYVNVQEPSTEMMIDICDFATVLYCVMAREGTPVLDKDYLYNLHEDAMVWEFNVPDECVSTREQALKMIAMRARAVQVAYKAMLGIEADSIGEEIKMSWEDFRNFWCCCGILIRYFTISNDVLENFRGELSNHIYIMYTQIAYHEEFFNLHHIVQSTTELQMLYKHNVLASCDLPADSHNDRLSERKRQIVCRVFNRLMIAQKAVCEIFVELQQNMNAVFSGISSGSTSIFDNRIEKKLELARDSINQMILTDTRARRTSQKLTSMFDVDALGYILVNSERYVCDGRFFVHCTGYAVDVGPTADMCVNVIEIPEKVQRDLSIQNKLGEIYNG